MESIPIAINPNEMGVQMQSSLCDLSIVIHKLNQRILKLLRIDLKGKNALAIAILSCAIIGHKYLIELLTKGVSSPGDDLNLEKLTNLELKSAVEGESELGNSTDCQKREYLLNFHRSLVTLDDKIMNLVPDFHRKGHESFKVEMVNVCRVKECLKDISESIGYNLSIDNIDSKNKNCKNHEFTIGDLGIGGEYGLETDKDSGPSEWDRLRFKVKTRMRTRVQLEWDY